MQKRTYLINRAVIALLICSVAMGCISSSKTTTTRRPGKKLVVSESGKYGLWFTKNTNDPRLVKKKLKKNIYYHVVSHPGGSGFSNSAVVMHWIERDPIDSNVITDTLKANDYNDHTYYGYYTSSREEPFGVGHWSNVEKVSGTAEIISDQMIKVNDLDIRLIVSKNNYLVKKGSSMFSGGYVGKEVARYFAHAFLNNMNFSLEIYQPIGGELVGSSRKSIDDKLALQSIEDFVQRYVEVL